MNRVGPGSLGRWWVRPSAHTNYTFRVAGVNSNGTGPFTAILSILTNEDGKSFYVLGGVIFILIVPGVVSNLTAEPRFTSIVLTWSPPQDSNGVIIAYGVTYRVNDNSIIATNTTVNSTTHIIELPEDNIMISH